MPLDRATRKAIARYGPTVNKLARRRYGISGQQLLARLTLGETGGDKNAVSPVGARGRTQFMPGSRAIAIKRFGVDPWASADEAIHAAALHLQGKINGSKGLEGYNPGDPSYTRYILGQKAPRDLHRGTPGASQHPTATSGNAALNTAGLNADAVSNDLAALLSKQLQHPQRPSGSVPALPSYAAQPVLAAQPITTGPRATKDDTLSALLGAVKTPSASLPATQQGQAKAGKGRLGRAGSTSKVVTFDGKPVVGWIARDLERARKTGLWNGTVTSGVRTKAEQLAAAKRFGLQHYGPAGPLGSNHVKGHRGAVDVTDPDGLARALRKIGSRLRRGMSDDPVHFSITGH